MRYKSTLIISSCCILSFISGAATSSYMRDRAKNNLLSTIKQPQPIGPHDYDKSVNDFIAEQNKHLRLMADWKNKQSDDIKTIAKDCTVKYDPYKNNILVTYPFNLKFNILLVCRQAAPTTDSQETIDKFMTNQWERGTHNFFYAFIPSSDFKAIDLKFLNNVSPSIGVDPELGRIYSLDRLSMRTGIDGRFYLVDGGNEDFSIKQELATAMVYSMMESAIINKVLITDLDLLPNN